MENAHVSPPPLPSPGASLPTSPTPASTPGPAATTTVASTCRAATFSPAPGAVSPIHATAGRPKALRWCVDTPSSGKSGSGSPPSFLEALLSGTPAMASQESGGTHRMTSVVAGGTSAPVIPRIVLVEQERGPRLAARVPDADGWMEAKSRRARQERRRHELRPRRPVPADLRGRCFNCFSPDHRAASCRSKTRCFRCRALGHRSSACQLRPGESRSRFPRLAWRPKTAPGGTVAALAASPPATDNVLLESSQGRKRRRRIRRRGKAARQEPSVEEDNRSSPSFPRNSSEDERPVAEEVPVRPRKIMDRSASIAQKEDRLARALVITVISGSPGSILPAIADRFEVEVSSLSLQRFGDARYLLILPSIELADRVYNGGRPITSSSLHLNVMRWTRLVNSSGAALSSPVEVEISGIPAHAWELSTAELILSDHCWISGVHPETEDRRDVFRVVAWSSCPSRIPSALDLEIVEPPPEVEDSRPMKRTLVCPITMSVTPVGLPMAPVAPPRPPADDERRRHGRRRPAGSPPGAPARLAVPRAPVHARLGPNPGMTGHVEQRDSVTASASPANIHGAATVGHVE
ncbi:unnamed protein product [Urochloa humidicola]